MTAKLHQYQAEQVGAKTAELYDYQYHQAANASLLLLDGTVQSVYCEWHDDYVLEAEGDEYRFHQVKTRSKKSGPWRINDFFGTGRQTKIEAKVKPAEPTSFFLKMFKTWRQFAATTKGCLFVSDNALDDSFQKLVDFCHACPSVNAALVDPVFKFVATSVSKTDSTIDAEKLLSFLRLFSLKPAMGAVDDLDACRAAIGYRMMTASEVDVLHSETRQMTLALVAIVKRKSQQTVSAPIAPDALRSAKAVTLPDLLNVLSLSSDGYDALKAGGVTAVRTLSRLHRWCRKLNFPEHVIPTLCALKAGWHVWWQANRLVLNQTDELELKVTAQQLLAWQNQPTATLETLIAQARLAAERLGNTLNTTPVLDADVLVGMALDMAVAAQGGQS